ncbi:PadR family transcriptional regulator [Oceanirhabdus seepicola]|uniref:Helix-turn-helix transcriptional regulator n=1 Tax=Oceanirhabdus seepicola TaxID=2828781 RepID=A0A9J6NV25_9CLOT|nr:PadR family transcriptional regulator [Oceanirhabdus seepicola]MCM1988335.1 helix-turn-helix transcriptional regulator [Oceanirhabdus seepicola]
MARKQLQNLTEPMYYVMLSLMQPIHGYGIMKNVDKITEGRVKVGAGTLYSLLSRFEKEEIVKKVSSEEGKKIYILTDKGLEILEEEHRRLKQLVKDGNVLLKEGKYEE